MARLVVDIETLALPGVSNLVAMPSIGAAYFSKKEGKYRVLHIDGFCIKAMVDLGGIIEPSTVGFWLRTAQQNPEAAQPIIEALELPVSKDKNVYKLLEFSKFVSEAMEEDPSFSIWGNGSEMDISVILAWFATYNIAPPWKFFQQCSMRSLQGFPNFAEQKLACMKLARDQLGENAVAHKADFDALYSAILVDRICDTLKI